MANEQGAHTYTNRLIHATSPYLLQHAHNPVDWHPWDEEALNKAKREDKPVLLSVGYAACHWCHVMEAESFENEETARLMNESFVNIKVDREERPDIDSIYMTALQAMTRGGGWPMTMFLTPDGVPFYGGTYFPPEPRHQLPSFSQVLSSVADAYKNRRGELLTAGNELLQHLREASASRLPEGQLSPSLLDDAYAALREQFDPANGGFGRAPKFPQPMTLEFLLRYARRTGAQPAWEMLHKTLRAMAEGGMYDQLGGGFHRYSVDERWLVPHFEKMLYDNALLARVYVEVFQATGEPFYRRVAEETLDYLAREMRHPAGGFYSTQDADSLPAPDAPHKHEGAFFVWTLDEVREALGGDALAFAQVFDITARGNFEGKNILNVKRRPADVARVTGLPLERVEQIVERGRGLLLEARGRRPRPDLDDKVLTAWNGMALRAFAQAAGALGREDYREVARQSGEFLLREMRRGDGTLIRAWRDTETNRQGDQETAFDSQAPSPQPRVPGFLEDYALLADGLLALYEATFEPRWLLAARSLADDMLARFWDDSIGGFYDTAADHEQLIVRPRDTGDNATPAGNSAAADVLLRLALIFDDAAYRERAETVLGGLAPFLARYPTGFGRSLAAAEFALAAPKEIALVGEPAAPDTQALREAIARPFLPNKVVLLARPGEPPAIPSPLLAGRAQVDGKATAYVCEHYACRLPVTDSAALAAQLAA
ncbi:MAG: thioredoxin domain-containing protein [Kouleothrix sp.]|nr:thioredoxin domain-containing protein [Kouleothrix sp.]